VVDNNGTERRLTMILNGKTNNQSENGAAMVESNKRRLTMKSPLDIEEDPEEVFELAPEQLPLADVRPKVQLEEVVKSGRCPGVCIYIYPFFYSGIWPSQKTEYQKV